MFVVSSIARKFAEFIHGQRRSIVGGDIEIVRDFLDVRDVVRAYYVLLKKGNNGEVYNVCSGKGISIKDVITMLMEITDTNPPLEIDSSLFRPVENRLVVGSNEKLYHLTGWQPEIGLKQTLTGILQYWQKVTAAQRA